MVVMSELFTRSTMGWWQADWPQPCIAVARLPGMFSMSACARPASSVNASPP